MEIGQNKCGPCGLSRTPEGHDGCLGTIEGAMNACCGHAGQAEGAYIQYGKQDAEGKWQEIHSICDDQALGEFKRLGIGPSFVIPPEEEVVISKSTEHVIWCHVKGFRVLEDGSVRSFTGKILKPRSRNKGKGRRALDAPYLEFSATDMYGKPRPCLVHRLAAYQKFGAEALLSSLVVRHKNNISSDNSLANILIGTHAENMADQTPETKARIARGVKLANRKITMEQAERIRMGRAKGVSALALSVKYNLAVSSIYDIVQGRTYVD